MEREELDGRPAYRLLERASRENPRFDERITWIDSASYVPLRQELRRGGSLSLRATTRVLREIHGVPTPVEMSFERPGQQRDVLLRFDSVDYVTPLGEEVFAILNLTRRRRELSE
jgi:hypothetical protein